MAWMVTLTVEPRYSPGISLPPENARFFLDLAERMRYEALVVDPATAPKRANYYSGGKTIPDFTAINGEFSVCQDVRDLIESLEPGVHQFLRVEVVRPRSPRPIHRLDGRALDTPYYILNIMTVLDAVWVERSHVRVHELQGRPPLVHLQAKGLNERGEYVYDVVLRREIIAGCHIWRGGRHGNGSIFFSNAMMEEVRRLKLKKLYTYHMEEA